MNQEKVEIRAEDIAVDGTTESQYADLNGIRIRLSRPLELEFNWIGNKKVFNQLRASWYSVNSADVPMCPRLIGKPGVGKTALAYSVGKSLGFPVYFFQATSDTKPNDVLINPVILETGKDQARVEYVASPLVSAMIIGGAIVFDEGNRMQEKAWAALAPLLDSRRYVESTTVGVLIRAHKNFRFVSTMNDDASCFDLPEYIKSRLQPQIQVDFPDRSEERRILEQNLPHTSPMILDYVADFLAMAHKEDDRITVREGIHVANYAGKLVEFEASCGREMDPGEAVVVSVEQVLGVRQARYIKRVLWQERAA